MAQLKISILGPLEVRSQSQLLLDFESDKVRALLAYLAVEADHPVLRENLSNMFWPDRPDAASAGNLRHTLACLRKTIGDHQAEPPYLLISRKTIQFNTTSHYSLDLNEFDKLIIDGDSSFRDRDAAGMGLPTNIFTESYRLSQLQTAVELYRGRLLEGFSLRGCPEFEDWILFQRERYREKLIFALRRMASLYSHLNDIQQAQVCLKKLLEEEPWDEVAHRRLMHLLALSGQRGAALSQYEACRRILADDLGVKPEWETIQLYNEICSGQPLWIESPIKLDEISTTSDRSAANFVDREKELDCLNRFLDRALAGQGRVIFITGEAGSGKTALAEAFGCVSMSHHAHLLVARGHSNAFLGAGTPYLPFREILQSLNQENNSFQNPFHPAHLQEDLYEQITQVLRLLAEQHPLLLLLDDLQWADRPTLNLLFNLGRCLSSSRILIVGIYRPVKFLATQNGNRHPLSKLVHEFQRIYGEILIDLDQADVWAFVSALLDREPNHFDPDFRQTLFEYTGGHPLFTVELLCSLQERGELFLDEKEYWQAKPNVDWDYLPARIRGVIAEQIAQLPYEYLNLLKAASVLGWNFSVKELACMLKAEEQEVVELLGAAQARQFNVILPSRRKEMGETNCTSGQCYQFRNRLYQKYLYQSLDEVEKMQLHKAASRAQRTLFTS